MCPTSTRDVIAAGMTSGDATDGLVRAAGGLVWRTGSGGEVEIVLVHRDRHDDWTYPKGKLDPGETWEQAAVREVFEETGIVGVLGPELGHTDYVDSNGRPKRARYWAMRVAADVGFTADDEISARRWTPISELGGLLTYDRDRDVLASFTARLGGSGRSR
jgi:8-oxo-dGTP pyrophosphatase MutT (NUDIX family)